jgi:hypothetical protein
MLLLSYNYIKLNVNYFYFVCDGKILLSDIQIMLSGNLINFVFQQIIYFNHYISFCVITILLKWWWNCWFCLKIIYIQLVVILLSCVYRFTFRYVPDKHNIIKIQGESVLILCYQNINNPWKLENFKKFSNCNNFFFFLYYEEVKYYWTTEL